MLSVNPIKVVQPHRGRDKEGKGNAQTITLSHDQVCTESGLGFCHQLLSEWGGRAPRPLETRQVVRVSQRTIRHANHNGRDHIGVGDAVGEGCRKEPLRGEAG